MGLAALLGLIGLLPVGADGQMAIDTAQARRYFEEASALVGPWEAVLPGPMLFADRATRTVVANVSAPGLSPSGAVFAGTLPENVGIANTAVEWAGTRWTMLAWPLPAGRYERARLIGHELFHRIQPALGFSLGNPSNAHLETLNGRLWLRAEWRALAAALAAPTAEGRRAAIRDALTFRAHRRTLVPAAAADENALEMNEGLAEYTGFVSTGLDADVLRGWALSWLEQSDARSASSGIARSFAYASGPAYGLLLDEVSDDWHRRIASVGDIGSLLAEVYGVDLPSDVAASADRQLALYDGARLASQERTREEARVAALERDRARYIAGPTLTLPVDDAFGYSFNPNDAHPFEDLGTVYGTAEVRGGWGTLAVTGGVLLLRNPEGRISGVVVPAPSDPAALAGDGWTLRLADGWTLRPGARSGDWVVSQ